MRFYYLFILLALHISTYSQTPTQIDSLGYKFSINLPEGSAFNFSDTYYQEEVKDFVYKTNFQIILKLDDHYIYVTIQKVDNFDKERAKKGWLKDSITKIAEETGHSLIIYTNENKNEEYHILYHKVLSEGAYTFSVFYQSLTFQEVKKVTQILDTAK
jgi:hypothetical protein